MSVKDKIAMWNNLAGNNATQTNSNKIVQTQPLGQMKGEDGEKKEEGHLQKSVPVVPHTSEAKKTEPPHTIEAKKTEPPHTIEAKKTEPPKQVQGNSAEIKTKPLVQSQKPKDPPKKQEPEKQQKSHEVEGGSLPKMHEIKKSLETQTAGRGMFFMPPPPPTVMIKKVESQISEENGEKATCEIENNAPILSVKEHAAKLAQFFVQKQNQGQELAHNKVVQQLNELELSNDNKKPEENHPKEEHKQPQSNCLNIAATDYIPPEEVANPPQGKPEEPQATLPLRFQNKGKRAKQQFDFDEI